MSLLANSNAVEVGGYTIDNSLRFRASANASLTRTPTSAGNRQIWTWSGWVKRTTSGNSSRLLSVGTDGNNFSEIYFLSGDTLDILFYTSGAQQARITTTPVYRDFSAWYHFVISVDTTQATAANRIKIYVNGSQVTALANTSYPSQNYNTFVNATNTHVIGNYLSASGGYPADMYLAEVNFIDGSAKTPSDFGETDTTTGVWKPKAYTGTYGTNGFYLPFKTYSTIGGQFSSYYGNFNSTGSLSTSTYLRINDNAAFNSGSSDFCWEVFFYADSNGGSLFGKGGSTIYEQIAVTYNGTNGITCYISNPSNVYIVGGTYTFSTLISNQWNHVAVYRSGSSWYIAVNGSVQNVATSSNSVIDNSGPFIIGGYSDASSQKGYPITGRMSNLRYVVGSSVYGA